MNKPAPQLTAKPNLTTLNQTGVLQRKCASCGNHTVAGGECADCGKKKGLLQRKAVGMNGVSEAPPMVHEVLGSSGQPLDKATRSFMEPRFGYDFSGVRVHADSPASESAQSVNALAYTVGNHVVFGTGHYSPTTTTGRRLLAHELTHVMQQGAGHVAPQAKLAIGAPSDASEREADLTANKVMSSDFAQAGQQPFTTTHTSGLLQRKTGDSHDLTAERFMRNTVLEAIYDNERMLKVGDKGTPVRKLQQALVDAGFSLPRFGVDGDFGSETKAAVEEFQRASGLTGANIDGIVGPTTMGWLDQRFSAGPTPTGTTLGATTGCPVIKTVNVDLVSLDGSTRNATQELDKASSIFNQCCVHFNFVTGGSEDDARTSALLGGDNILNKTTACGSPTAEETSLFSGASADFSLSSRIRAFYVNSTTPSVPAYSFPPFCATGGASALRDMAVVTNTASVRGLAHEFGHILLNNGTHPSNSLNLMSAPGSPPGEQLSPTDCATIFANA